MAGKHYFFSTRDLLIMAALASLGGIAGTYINALGDAVQSVLGFAGTTQWAAGLHVLWLILAAAIVKKPGAGTITGMLKGVVELLTGNTHGLLVLLIDLIAGVLIDLGFLPFGKKRNLLACILAGGLASASNIFVFQLFASLPADILSYGALALVGVVAFVSGVIFAGLLGWMLLNALQQAGVIKQVEEKEAPRKVVFLFMAGAVLITVLLTIFLRSALQGPLTVSLAGSVHSPFDFPAEHADIQQIEAEGTLRGTTLLYTGYPVKTLVEAALPVSEQGWILVQGSDGYSFFISMDEVQENPSLLLTSQGEGKSRSFNLVGAENSKAWVRAVQAILVVTPPNLEISGLLDKPGDFDPEIWQFEMDSIALTMGDVSGKYQGVALSLVLQEMGIQPQANEVLLIGDESSISLDLSTILNDQDLRIFTIIVGDQVSYAIARMDGHVIVSNLERIEVR